MVRVYVITAAVAIALASTMTAQSGSGSAFPQPDSVTYSDVTGASHATHPVTLLRFFKQGDIPNYAQPRIGGAPVAQWQNDVQGRWNDGSLKSVFISFWLPAMTSNGAVSVDFVNYTAGPCHLGTVAACHAGALTQSQMTGFDTGGGAGSWSGTLTVAFAGLLASARVDNQAVIAAGAWKYRLQGPVATQVIAEDRSPALSYDFGATCLLNCTGDRSTAVYGPALSSRYNSLHPIFVTTFYPGWAGVDTEWIIEDVWDTRAQDISYTVTYTTGKPAQVVYGPVQINQPGATRWHKSELWSGAAPPVRKVDLNLSYLEASMVVPNFDQSLVVTTSGGVATQLNEWATSDKAAPFGNYDNTTQGYGPASGLVGKALNATGPAEWISYFPSWDVRYLYTFHRLASGPDLYSVSLGNGDVSGYMSIHVAMTSTSLTFCGLSATCQSDGNASVSAFGMIQSKDAYPNNINANHPQGFPSSWNPTDVVPTNAAVCCNTPSWNYSRRALARLIICPVSDQRRLFLSDRNGLCQLMDTPGCYKRNRRRLSIAWRLGVHSPHRRFALACMADKRSRSCGLYVSGWQPGARLLCSEAQE